MVQQKQMRLDTFKFILFGPLTWFLYLSYDLSEKLFFSQFRFFSLSQPLLNLSAQTQDGLLIGWLIFSFGAILNYRFEVFSKLATLFAAGFLMSKGYMNVGSLGDILYLAMAFTLALPHKKMKGDLWKLDILKIVTVIILFSLAALELYRSQASDLMSLEFGFMILMLLSPFILFHRYIGHIFFVLWFVFYLALSLIGRAEESFLTVILCLMIFLPLEKPMEKIIKRKASVSPE